MKFNLKLSKVKLIKRYKRFLTDVELDDGSELTVHCPNTGSMKNCQVEGSTAWISDSQNSKRKYPHTWELATTPAGAVASINTHRANSLVVEAIETGVIKPLQHYEKLDTEKKYGNENSRIDILLENDDNRCYVEVKSVTLEGDDASGGSEQGWFPDAVSDRASKHLRELMLVKEQGDRAVLIFCVQHTGIKRVSPADHIDAKYGETLRQAVTKGVEVYAYGVSINESEIVIDKSLPIVID